MSKKPVLINMARTRRALEVYDRGQAKRKAAWDRIGSNKGVRIAEAMDALALFKVQMAFAVDTYDRNSLSNCKLVGIDDLRRMAEINEKTS
jgi:hypothetical protein